MEIPLTHHYGADAETGADDLWARLLDPLTLVSCIPGITHAIRAGSQVQAQIRLKVGAVPAVARLEARVAPLAGERCTVAVEAIGAHRRTCRVVRARILVTVDDAPTSGARCEVSVGLAAEPPLEDAELRQVDALVGRLVPQFVAALEQRAGEELAAAPRGTYVPAEPAASPRERPKGSGMEIENSFVVPLGVAEAWELLLDPARVARCLPGATLDSVAGDVMRGRVKVKLGPMTMSYEGTARFVHRDDRAHTVSLDASGRDKRGSGGVSATMRMALTEAAEGTRCLVVTDVAVTGKAAQFGRSVMSDVSARLIDEFARRLAVDAVAGPAGATRIGVTEAAQQDDTLDLLQAVGWKATARMAAPVAVGVALVGLVALVLRRARDATRRPVVWRTPIRAGRLP
jgi:uncharacterized protein